MANSASYRTSPYDSSVAEVLVNNTTVMGLTTASGTADINRASIIADRLNTIFGQSTRDLDFITVGYVNGYYALIASDVYRGSGPTWFVDNYCGFQCAPYEDVNGDRKISENLYSDQVTLIATVTDADTTSRQWEHAFAWAQNVRGAINAIDALGNSVGTLPSASRTIESPGTVLASGEGAFFGLPTQGTSKYDADNICCATLNSGQEIFHPMDLIVAMNNSSWRNKWVEVEYPATGKRVVCRAIDYSPRAAELSNGAAKAVGYPGSGTLVVRAI